MSAGRNAPILLDLLRATLLAVALVVFVALSVSAGPPWSLILGAACMLLGLVWLVAALRANR